MTVDFRRDRQPKLELSTPVQYLKGVGPQIGGILQRRDIATVGQLLEHYPRAFEDRRCARNIASLKPGDVVSIKARIRSVTSVPLGRSSGGSTQRKIYDVILQDGTGIIHCKYFRVPYRGYFDRFQPDQEVRVIGKVIHYRGKIEFHHPDLRSTDEEQESQDQVVPIYPEIDVMTSTRLGSMIQLALKQLAKDGWPPERLPESLRRKYALTTRREALELIHRPPQEGAGSFNERRSPAHRRVIFEEFFWLELSLACRRAGFKKEHAEPIIAEGKLVEKLLAALAFKLTGAQQRAFADVRADLRKSEPMLRLVQGDVGSGKTMVAFMAACDAIEAGAQACLMAPTEILAEQHLANAKKSLEPLGIRVELLSGKTKKDERARILEGVRAGETQFLIGTHALLEDPVQFDDLKLVIIDEQHRFGVEQRAALKRKGAAPHFLVMTATPIPRTLAMTVYGDLDASIIDEMPPGRSPIQTRAVFESKREEVNRFMLAQLEKGRQAYVVYPLVEESEKIDLKNAIEEFNRLKAEFPNVTFGLLHGRMKSDEKEAVMTEFREGRLQVLVSTTVIEVGVDVPNANLMIVEHAERFGLSQLHQLRGRVGRGAAKSFCVLVMGRAVSEEARERTRFMETTTDGFKVAEFDLQLRGPGEFLGRRQSGLPGFKMANLVTDIELLQAAREAAFGLLETDPKLRKAENTLLREELLKILGPEGTLLIG